MAAQPALEGVTTFAVQAPRLFGNFVPRRTKRQRLHAVLRAARNFLTRLLPGRSA